MDEDEKKLDEAAPATETGDMTLAEVAALVKELAPQIAAMQKALAALAPAVDPVEVDPAAAVVAEDEDDKEGEKVAAMDAKIKRLESTVASLKSNQLSAKAVMQQVTARDALAKDLSQVVGAFDHSSLTLDEVGKYGAEKLAIACDKGTEVVAVRAFLQGRKPVAVKPKVVAAQDGSTVSALDAYLEGGAQ
jgi:small-conductance mechanosensitive channel